MSTLLVVGGAAGAAIAIGTVLVKYVVPSTRAVAKFIGKASVALDLFTGRPPMIDEATGRRLPAVLPLGQALAEIRTDLNDLGQTVSDLTSVVQQVADQQMQIAAIIGRLDDHDTSIAALIGSTFERGANANLTALEVAQAAAARDPEDDPT